jgi:hypothetical protein
MPRRQFLWLLLSMMLFSCDTRADGTALVITRGGKYTGNYSSIEVKTREPVVIENATLRGTGTLISSHYRAANLTIRNVRGSGPDEKQHAGRFASLEGFNNVVIENCLLEHTTGIYLLDYAGDRTEKNTIKIVRNRVTNIDGRKNDGKAELVQFVQLDKCRHVPAAEIAWNEVVNEPGKSCVEDNISIYLSSGTPKSPIAIHNNFIRGAYPASPATGGYSGGGIMLGDGVAKEGADGDSSYVHAFENQVLDTVNYGIAISAGHDCRMYRNRIVSAGVLPDGKKIAAQNVGAYVWDSYKAGQDHFFNNGGSENVIGWVKGAVRNDWWRPGAQEWDKNENWPDPITPAVYDAEWKLWQEKLKTANVLVGPKS